MSKGTPFEAYVNGQYVIYCQRGHISHVSDKNRSVSAWVSECRIIMKCWNVISRSIQSRWDDSYFHKINWLFKLTKGHWDCVMLYLNYGPFKIESNQLKNTEDDGKEKCAYRARFHSTKNLWNGRSTASTSTGEWHLSHCRWFSHSAATPPPYPIINYMPQQPTKTIPTFSRTTTLDHLMNSTACPAESTLSPPLPQSWSQTYKKPVHDNMVAIRSTFGHSCHRNLKHSVPRICG